MYKTLVKVAPSAIDGEGVFAQQDIKHGSIVWQFDEKHDHRITQACHEELPEEEKKRLERVAYLSPWSGLWVYPPTGDPAEYTNHSNNNNLTTRFDSQVSPEPYFIANRDIKSGEELTNNYREFDEITRISKPEWSN